MTNDEIAILLGERQEWRDRAERAERTLGAMLVRLADSRAAFPPAMSERIVRAVRALPSRLCAPLVRVENGANVYFQPFANEYAITQEEVTRAFEEMARAWKDDFGPRDDRMVSAVERADRFRAAVLEFLGIEVEERG